MRFTLKEYQDRAVRDVLRNLSDARDDYRGKDRRIAFALSAITGAGKTVMASAVFEAMFKGSEEYDVDPDQTATVLWVTDDPNLNEQTRYRIMEASDTLDASHLRVIGDGFDEEKLEPGAVYFLNRQKLTAKTFITHSDQRTYTLWETIKNTIEDPERTLFLVLDEAHRGMKYGKGEEKDRSTTVLRLINGHADTPAAPIVWGISATVDRFNEAMKDATGRTTYPNVVVENALVQASGLLKDTITLDLPDEAGAFETVLAREAGKASHEISELWRAFADQEKLADSVEPLLVVQVPNKPAVSLIVDLLDAIYDAWPELPQDAVANVFGEHTDETFGKHAVPYIPPQDVQDASNVRVLLAKDAISTGWDCPRAETLVSLRPAKDKTHITQLLGRLVRTPLARRIDSDERLNAVTCFLPQFDLTTAKQVADVMTGATTDEGAPPPPPGGRVLIEPATMLWNSALPDAVRNCFADLPSKAAPKTPAKPLKRMLNLAAELAVDELMGDPNAEAHERMYAVLAGQAAQRKSAVSAAVKGILTADIKRLTANRLNQSATEEEKQLAADERTVNDAFRVATRSFGASIANGYVKRLAIEESEETGEDLDIYAAKAAVAALAGIPEVLNQLETAAEQQVAEWFSSLHAVIKGLNEDRRSVYDDIRTQSRDPQHIDIVVPTSRIEMTYSLEGETKTHLPARERHLLADDAGLFPVGRLGSAWELDVLDTEMNRDQAVAWYRNPSTASKDAVQVPWWDGTRWRSMQPDFVFFSQKKDGTIGASIVDPHGHYLQDAYGKLLGLAEFAEEYGGHFMRIDAISKNTKGDLDSHGKDDLVLLDLTESEVRQAVRDAESAAAVYAFAGTKYM